MENKNLVIVGSANVDLVVNVCRLPRAGETVLASSGLQIFAGGKGANQAVAAAKLSSNGIQVSLIARVGMDSHGEFLFSSIKQTAPALNIKQVLQTKNTPTGCALIQVEENGENTIVVASGSNAEFSPDSLLQQYHKSIDSLFRNTHALLLQLEIPQQTVILAASLVRKTSPSGIIVLNPSPIPKNGLNGSHLENIDILILNEHEAEIFVDSTMISLEFKLTKEVDENDGRIEAMNRLCWCVAVCCDRILENSRKVRITVIMTAGSLGSFVNLGSDSDEIRSKSQFVKAFHVERSIDSTGAGDTFCGALIVSLLKTQVSQARDILSNLEAVVDAVKYANLCAAISVTKIGAQSSMPDIAEVEDALKSYALLTTLPLLYNNTIY
mmetsp:Transcript_9489/g.17116  ORF Transcript_9489/g.17116 Transcript_9489/m.17116 type:complete len:383 (-) Transcript_9489:608-1756(-)